MSKKKKTAPAKPEQEREPGEKPPPVKVYTTNEAIFGVAVQTLRYDLLKTQKKLAEALGISLPQYSRLEKGRSVVTMERTKEVAKALETKDYELMMMTGRAAGILEDRGVEIVKLSDLNEFKRRNGTAVRMLGEACSQVDEDLLLWAIRRARAK